MDSAVFPITKFICQCEVKEFRQEVRGYGSREVITVTGQRDMWKSKKTTTKLFSASPLRNCSMPIYSGVAVSGESMLIVG